MKGSFGCGGMGGGGGMLGTVIRSGAGGAQEALSRSITTTKNNNKPTSLILSLSSSLSASASTSLNLTVSGTSPSVHNWASCASSSYFCDGDEWEWESVNGEDQDRANMIFDNYVFGSVPSQDEVEDAVSSLKQIVAPALYSQFCEDKSSSSLDEDVIDHTADPARSELDWIEPTFHLYNPRLSQSHQYGRVYDAFHLLQTEPSIQRMVVSLSSDKAVWDAVLNNEVVKELKESFCIAEDANSQRSDGSPDTAASILKWMLNNTKAKVLELIEKLRKLVNEVFRIPQKNNSAATTDLFEDKLRTSLLISIVVLLIVVVTRAHRA